MRSPLPEAPPVASAQKWAITFTVMVVAFMQILDTSVTNVILPHLQGSMSAGLDEVSWVITSYLAANAVVIPATGWLAGLFGRKRFFLICSTLFVASSFLSGIAPNLTTLIVARIFQGLGGGPIIPLSQAILWEIFPFHQRGLAMAIWGVGFILGPILGPTVGGYLADEWSWRWIFYINLPVGILGFLMASAFLFDPPYLRRAARIDWWGLGLMVVGFACLQLVLDRGEREDWFDSPTIVAMTIVAVCALAGFLIRELLTSEPIVDLTAFTDRNFATGVTLISVVGFGMFSGMLLVAVFTQQLLGYDAWTSGLVLAPGGLGNICSLFASGIVTRVDQRWMLAFGCLLNALSLYMMTSLTLDMDYWALALPRFIQGFAVGFIFVPLSTLMTHITAWDWETRVRLARWARHFVGQGSDTFTADRQAVVMLYRETVSQAQLLAYADDFWLLAMMFVAVPLMLPFMRRIRLEPTTPATARADEPAAAHVMEEGAV